jgi:hypothetical protein
MAQKFGNGRWVKEGWLDNRVDGCVVGRITFAAIGTVDVYLRGNCRGEIAGQAICFRNPRFEAEEVADHVIGDLDNPQIGDVILISFDPHPNLPPHPYIEWFSVQRHHYRIELEPQDAWILSEAEAAALDHDSRTLRETLGAHCPTVRDHPDWERD